MNQVVDETDCISAVVNGERHYTDGKRHYIERDYSVLEYVGPLSEAHADVIAAFLQCPDCLESQYECKCEKPGDTPVGTF